MHILIVHNDYGVYSGEEASVDRMIADAQQCGHTVSPLRRTSASKRDTLLGKIHGFFSGIYSVSGRSAMRKAIRNYHPDIVIIHNLYPFISPAVLPLCRRAGIPVVMTVHNYRLICPTGLFLRNGQPCENCLKKGNEWDCIRNNCEHSRFRSLGYTIRNVVARRRRYYFDNVDCYGCLTQFQKRKLIEAGYDGGKLKIVPNYIDFSTVPTPIDPGEYIAYVGRLSPEKGFDLLIEVARRHPELKFHFAGDFRDGHIPSVPKNVELLGVINSKQLINFYRNARFVVIPSRCYEGFPSVLIEAASHARCCIGPNHGAFPDIICAPNEQSSSKLLFTPNDINDLEDKVVALWNNPEMCRELGKAAFENCNTNYSKGKVINEWNDLLTTIVSSKKNVH